MVAPERCPRCSARRVEGIDTCPRCQWRFVIQPTTPARPAPSATSGSRCPACSRFAGLDAAYCPHCGATLKFPAQRHAEGRSPRPEAVAAGQPRSLVHQVLRLLLTTWLVAYPLVACVPVLLGSASGGAAGGAAVLGGLIAGWYLLIPWLVGVLVLGLLAVLSR